MNAARRANLCSHSISRRASSKLALLTMLVLGAVFFGSWCAIKMLIMQKNREELTYRSEVIARVLESKARIGGADACITQLQTDAAMRPNSHIRVSTADGRLLYADPTSGAHQLSSHVATQSFAVPTPNVGGGSLKVDYTMDFAADAKLGRYWAIALTLLTLVAGAAVGAATYWQVRRQLRPLRDLAEQTRSISPDALDQRLDLADPAEELLPWVTQFNGLMDRLERSYRQLEGFNADVAHELRTPIAALMGHTEVALSRERSADALREVLVSNLEEMQRLAAMVNDMLFLSRADRGVTARRGERVSLAALAGQVVDFHDAQIEDSGLTVEIVGDVVTPVDEPLFKRAVSNLLGNAIRYAERGSRVAIHIEPDAPGHVRVVVDNAGPAIAPQHLARLFDRFFRADDSRSCDSEHKHHGLGLAIVAAIARMHAGRTLAESAGGRTRVGFTLAARP